MNEMKEEQVSTPNDMPHARPEPFVKPSLSSSVEDTLRTVLCRVDPRKSSVDQVRGHLAAAGILASREWVHDWLDEVNDRGRR